jgi:Tfp pilus assembly protein PilF
MRSLSLLALLTAVLLGLPADAAERVPFYEQPMYGLIAKSDELKKADQTFIDGVIAKYETREAGSKVWVNHGWAEFRKKDFKTAMMRFNQAWLLDAENGDTYYGFALVLSERKAPAAEIEKLFLTALSKANVSILARVDYGRFLWTQKRLDESLVQLQQVVDVAPTVYGAHAHIAYVYFLKRNFDEACRWGKIADDHGVSPTAEKGFTAEMCRRAGKT